MAFSASILSVIQQRYSCRNYASSPLNDDTQRAVSDYLQQLPAGPFQKSNRFTLIAATDPDRSALRGLGTYGFIKNPLAFIIGASEEGSLTLEDFGYRMEQIVLQMTRLGLGTCWLGGTFTRSAFAQRLGAGRNFAGSLIAGLPLPGGSPSDEVGATTARLQGAQRMANLVL